MFLWLKIQTNNLAAFLSSSEQALTCLADWYDSVLVQHIE